MREHKFRRWDKNNKRFAYMELFNKGTYQITDFPDGGEGLGDYEQFTGLYDKNGEPVFEGDFVRFLGIKAEIHYSVNHCKWFYGIENLNPTVSENGEIIGTIHQNPELIKGAS
jgi:hypothetical protein